MAERLLGQGNKERPFLNRRNAGTAMEVGGVIVGAEGLLSLSILGMLAGGMIWLIGDWVKNYGNDSKGKS